MDVSEPVAAEETHADTLRVRRLSPARQVLLLGVLAAAGVAGWLSLAAWQRPAADTQAPPASVAEAGAFQATPQQWAGFTIAPVAAHAFQDDRQTDGRIANDDDLTTPVFSPFTGRVTRLFAHAGDQVRAGDPLLAVQAAEFVQAQNDLISAAATLATTRAQMALAQTNEKRAHDLFAAQGGALKDWQQSQVDLASARGALRSAGIALAAVRNRLRILGRSDAEIDAMEQADDVARLPPEVVVPAPVGGTVLLRQVGIGQNIVSQANGGSNPVFSIGDTSHVWLLANVRETDVPLIRLGDPVEVQVPAWPGRVFAARIAYVAPSLDPGTHRLPVRAEVDNPDGALKPEMFARFRIVTGAGTTSPAVPEGAVVFEGEAAHVWVADPAHQTIALRSVRTGRTSDGLVQITDGLHAGEQVVTRGSLFLDKATAGD